MPVWNTAVQAIFKLLHKYWIIFKETLLSPKIGPAFVEHKVDGFFGGGFLGCFTEKGL